jgi:hypothetical protein
LVAAPGAAVAGVGAVVPCSSARLTEKLGNLYSLSSRSTTCGTDAVRGQYKYRMRESRAGCRRRQIIKAVQRISAGMNR